MDDGTGALLQHHGQQPPVQPDGGEQIPVQGLQPVFIGQDKRPARRCAGASHIIHQNINTAQHFLYPVDNLLHPFRSGNIRLHEQLRLHQPGRPRTGSRQHGGTAACQPFGDRFPHSPCASGHQHSFSFKFMRWVLIGYCHF
ncbi:hypothetical protein D3C81_1456080 [compost metagenome]